MDEVIEAIDEATEVDIVDAAFESEIPWQRFVAEMEKAYRRLEDGLDDVRDAMDDYINRADYSAETLMGALFALQKEVVVFISDTMDGAE